jgi:hypothetical protein
MSVRFEDVGEEVLDLMMEVRAEHFPELRSVKIKVLFDLKKRMSGGMLVLGRCQKSNDLIKHLTAEESQDEDGVPYLIYLDKNAWDNIEKVDRVRLMRHELRHIDLDLESERNPFKIAAHDLTDFYEEVELNKDDSRWCQRVVGLTEAIYSQQRDMEETAE